MAVRIDDDMSAAEAKLLSAKLIAFADTFTPPRNYREFGLVIRDDAGELVGGIRANTVWDWLQIDSLWVADELRGRGYGRQLLAQAEARARAMGCRYARLNTFEFEARGFYEKNGYVVAFEMNDFPDGHTQYRLTKTFSPWRRRSRRFK